MFGLKYQYTLCVICVCVCVPVCKYPLPPHWLNVLHRPAVQIKVCRDFPYVDSPDQPLSSRLLQLLHGAISPSTWTGETWVVYWLIASVVDYSCARGTSAAIPFAHSSKNFSASQLCMHDFCIQTISFELYIIVLNKY